MSYTTDQFFHSLSIEDYGILCVDLNVNGSHIAALQSNLQLQNLDNAAIEDLVERQKFYKGKWTRFNIMVASYLKFCRDLDPWSVWASSDMIFQYYSDLNNCLLNDSYPLDNLIDVYLQNTEYVLSIAQKLDNNYRSLNTRKFQFMSYVSSVISKLFNSIKPNKSTDGGEAIISKKQQTLLYLVNKLNNIYFKIKSPQLCSNIFKNFKPKSDVKNFGQFPVNQQIEYRYLLGKYYLFNARITNAFVQLNSAYSLLAGFSGSRNPAILRNLRRLLRYLIPVGLIIGKLPNVGIVAQVYPELAQMYRPLIQAARSGNIFALNEWFRHNELELRQRQLLLILVEKLPMITYRYLLRRVIQIRSSVENTNRLSYDVLQKAFELAIQDNGNKRHDIYDGIHDSKNAENVLVTLINLGYFRGNCFPLLQLCVFQRTENIDEVLPSVTEKIIAMFPLNNEDAWLDS
ncbi:Thp1p KNAG_0K01000 [Huiozyma naganishii CBS 8797]|uniref:PCI domain-containing protein n=1 Tax=Huiozyma naganishii (strain ATCC MYA-139 / BCRC 22969 / CBS 8797 / KCTC 17520 / NBRC 10181 / NCYC 3082 / Yp74L-3) TaxID=1071383 RepID=J7RC82_HUIN7|nr:hypothetical protein KNAG_0K01000 [Kazachstania naganishii CBS 8797]CCK72465.1 hypothetical protein KNAG_0K01000 [Kazachstania naganishii CBS 8797]